MAVRGRGGVLRPTKQEITDILVAKGYDILTRSALMRLKRDDLLALRDAYVVPKSAGGGVGSRGKPSGECLPVRTQELVKAGSGSSASGGMEEQ
eukprot:11322527-Heterocapsa_arctica.AAC.1